MRLLRHRLGCVFSGLAFLVLATVGGAQAFAASQPVVADDPPAVTSPAPTLTHRLVKDIEDEVARVEPWLQRYGYWAIFGAVGVEGFGIPTPGQTVLEAGAAASASVDARLRIGWILLVAFLAASLGNTLGYMIGRLGGRAMLHRLHIPQRHLDKVENGFDRYGGWLIVFARFFDGLRQLNGIGAGILEMPWTRFTLFNLMGAALWACFWGLGVYYLDLDLDAIVGLIRRINPWVAAVTLAGVGAVVAILWLKYGRHRTGAD